MSYTRGQFVAKALSAGAGAVALGSVVRPALATPASGAAAGALDDQESVGRSLRGRVAAVQPDGSLTVIDKTGRWRKARVSSSTQVWKAAKHGRNRVEPGDSVIGTGSMKNGVFEIQRVWVATEGWGGALSFFPDPPHACPVLHAEV